MLVEQHQQTSLLQGSREHELNVGGADITWSRWFDPLTPVGGPTEVRSHMKEKRPFQTLHFGFRSQLVHQRLQHPLQAALSIHRIRQESERTVEIDRGGHLGIEHCALGKGLELRLG